jgi:hypothetical protein
MGGSSKFHLQVVERRERRQKKKTSSNVEIMTAGDAKILGHD